MPKRPPRRRLSSNAVGTRNSVAPGCLLGNYTAGNSDLVNNSSVISGLPVRTKPQAPRSLQYWLTSSFVAGIVCESQEVTHCDSYSQNDARRARASQLLCRHDAALSAFRRTVRTTLRQVAGPARSG